MHPSQLVESAFGFELGRYACTAQNLESFSSTLTFNTRKRPRSNSSSSDASASSAASSHFSSYNPSIFSSSDDDGDSQSSLSSYEPSPPPSCLEKEEDARLKALPEPVSSDRDWQQDGQTEESPVSAITLVERRADDDSDRAPAPKRIRTCHGSRLVADSVSGAAAGREAGGVEVVVDLESESEADDSKRRASSAARISPSSSSTGSDNESSSSTNSIISSSSDVNASASSLSSSSSFATINAACGLEGKTAFVDGLVDAAAFTLDAIWQTSSTCQAAANLCTVTNGASLPLQLFIRETLRRSRTSCSTLQAALLYCVRSKKAVIKARESVRSPSSSFQDFLDRDSSSILLCARRMFLAAIMVSSKFLQDKTYSNRAWAKISGLPIRELGKLERVFLSSIDYRLVVNEGEWQQWVIALKDVRAKCGNTVAGCSGAASVELGARSGRSFLCRSTSNTVTGMALPHDSELTSVAKMGSDQAVDEPSSRDPIIGGGRKVEIPLPYPRAQPRHALQPASFRVSFTPFPSP